MTPGFVETSDGRIEWVVGTGDNAELRHLRVHHPGRGAGRRLLVEMLTELLKNPPYATVYGFTRASNQRAQAFYRSVGFALRWVDGVYDEPGAYLFTARFRDLCEFHGLES